MPMTTANSIIHMFPSSWWGSLRGRSFDRWCIGRDDETVQEVQVKMLDALKCMNVLKRLVKALVIHLFRVPLR